MDIHIMEYYLAIIREGNISAAAESLHLSQPALSRQIKDLEEELGVTLFERGSRKIKLTEEGMILRRRAEEMVRLMQITESEIREAQNKIAGEIHIGAGESLAFHHLSRIAGNIHQSYPDIRFRITSGDTADLMDQLDNGLIDIALIFTDYDHSQYQGIRLPKEDKLGLLMKKDDPLSAKTTIAISDLKHIPLIIPRAAEDLINSDPAFTGANIVTVYNLIYNASLFVEDGVGYAIGFDGLINTTGDSPLTFRPIENQISQPGTVIWKKYEVFTPAVNLFLEQLKESSQASFGHHG
ncbi:MAG: LysR family transcriptional regulator [Solobacterium sp.]|nr:LysR family transcriptional regulator [Solobacterium sp.]